MLIRCAAIASNFGAKAVSPGVPQEVLFDSGVGLTASAVVFGVASGIDIIRQHRTNISNSAAPEQLAA